MKFTRPSFLVFLRTGRYLDESYDWERFDIETWSEEEYDWRRDPWNGVRDFVNRPEETVETGRGDCDDYALVAASWASAVGREGVGMAVCGSSRVLPQHMVAFDSERTYSSGTIHDCGPGEYLDGSDYSWLYARQL